MPNVLILPRSADYSEEVWMEIREKTISILQAFFLDGATPKDCVSDEEEEGELGYENQERDTQNARSALQGSVGEDLTEDTHVTAESSQRRTSNQLKEPPVFPKNASGRSEAKRSRSSKKTKRRHARQKSQHKVDDHSNVERESSSYHEDDTAMSGTDQVLSSNSRFASPDDLSRKEPIESIQESSEKSSMELSKKSVELLKDGCIIALHARDHHTLHISRQRVKGGGWFLDSIPNVTKRDPAAQFLVVFRSKVCIFCFVRSYLIHFCLFLSALFVRKINILA